MKRSALIEQINRELDGRRVVWFGTRGDDIESVLELRDFYAAFSILDAHRKRRTVEYHALEQLTGVRVDLDQYDLDEEPDIEAFARFRSLALRALAKPNAVFTYRPSTFVSALCFARRDRCRYLGMFRDHQAAFEHKPWVESSIRGLGVPAIPWHYVADEDQAVSIDDLRDGPIMLRRSRSSGGTGLVRVDDPKQIRDAWPHDREAYVSIAPYLDGGLPVNVGGVVWSDGITLHPASVQLIGIPSCTTRPFGYCGNDFALLSDLPADLLDEIERSTLLVAGWLRRHGYLGAFGVDYLVKDGVPLFTEVNPRFQGSTHLSCEISTAMGEGCLLLDHLAAHLGIPAPPSLRLRDYLGSADVSHVVVHSLAAESRTISGASLIAAAPPERVRRADVVVTPAVGVQPGATLARITFDGSVTTTGFDLEHGIDARVGSWQTRSIEPSDDCTARTG